MSDRQYGISPGHVHGVPLEAPQARGPMAPTYPQNNPPRPVQTNHPLQSRRQISPPRPHKQADMSREQTSHVMGPSAPVLQTPAPAMPNISHQDGQSNALRDIDHLYGSSSMLPADYHDDPYASHTPYNQELQHTPYSDRPSFDPGHAAPYFDQAPYGRGPSASSTYHHASNSQSSFAPLVATRSGPSPPSPPRNAHLNVPPQGIGLADFRGSSPRSSYYHGDGYDDFDPIDPREIADDGEDGLEDQPPGGRRRVSRLHAAFGGGAGAAAGTAAAGGAGMLGAFGSRAGSGSYNPVGNNSGGVTEKSEWLQEQSSGRKRMKWIIGSIIVVVVLALIAGGVVAGVLVHDHNDSSSSSSSSTDSGGLYDIHSKQVQAVLNNPDLHKVFPGMDYTPLNAQYPGCLTVPPDQNNITLDVAVLSQLTPAIRLYGTDCNQTEMVLAGISQLGFNDSMQVWLGVYLGSNETTNARQLAQMYAILDAYPAAHFAGVIVGNEVLYEQTLTAAELGAQLAAVRSNLTAKSIALPVATSDLGVDWSENTALVADSDIVMANVHPFFAGVTASDGANWAWTFWHGTDVPLTTAATGSVGALTYPKQIISEIGWPSQGGHDCGGPADQNYGCTTATDGAVASVANINTFMDVWVCQALANGTTFFWLEAFDEPWKNMFDTDDDNWEPHWGLMDVNRNLKSGVQIPDCGGKTVDKPY